MASDKPRRQPQLANTCTVVSFDDEEQTTDLIRHLRVRVNFAEVARGLLQLMSRGEIIMLRTTGMLPVRIMNCFTQNLRRDLLARWKLDDKTEDGSLLCAHVKRDDSRGLCAVYFRMKKLTDEITHHVVLEIYRLANLLV